MIRNDTAHLLESNFPYHIGILLLFHLPACITDVAAASSKSANLRLTRVVTPASGFDESTT